MARKSRIITTKGRKPGSRVWLTAIYIRLSKEDARSNDESESVTNQRNMIEEHIASMNDGDEYRIVREYVDDGVSGTTDDERGGFQEMLADIRRGWINCVIVKDLARSFRNYSDQGYYLDDWFPRHNVRFISLFHQSLDSYREPGMMRNIAVPIQGVMNENHCAETSEKVREVFDMKRCRGEHIGAFAPFGYRKHPCDHNVLMIDEQAAGVVRDIYAMFLSGMSKNAIAHALNDEGVLCPAAYKREVLGQKYYNPGVNSSRRPLWTAASVTTILKNQMYCGDMVQGRYRRKSYKVHVQERVPEDEWYIVKNTHEPIIERPVFENTQRLLSGDTRSGPQQQQLYLFSGFLRCADCGSAMTRSKVKGKVYYYCRTYKDKSKHACTKHSIRHDRLEAAVLYAVRQQIYLAVNDEELIADLNKMPRPENLVMKNADSLAQREKELAKVKRYKQAAWQDWKDGEITPEEYHYMKSDYEERMESLLQSIQKLQQAGAGTDKDKEDPLWSYYREQRNIDQLSRDVLGELIDVIEVGENGNIGIKFRFTDVLRVPFS